MQERSPFPKGTGSSARPAFGDRTSVAIAVALMVALTLLFLPWSTIRPGLREGGGSAGSGVGAAPSGPGPALNARIGKPTIGVVAIAQPLAVTRAGSGSGPIGPPTKSKPPKGPGTPVVKFPSNHTGKKHHHPWGNGHQGDGGHGNGGDGGDGDGHHGDGGHGNGHQGDGGHGNGHQGDGGHGNGHHGNGNGGGKGGWGGGHDGDHQSGHHDGGHHRCGHRQSGNRGDGAARHGRDGNHRRNGNRAVLTYLA
jgi:hypothetical protein